MDELSGSDDMSIGPATTNKYRPPPGFMNDVLPDDATSRLDPNEMISKLRARAGHWHQLAKFIPALLSKGYDSVSLEGATGITPAEQNRWVVAATVYDSLSASDKVAAAVLRRFDAGGENLLYHFRFLSSERRVQAAEFIVRNDLDQTECEVLARSMKEWERRPLERKGFAAKPGDCLAFKYLRDAIECRFPQEAMEKLQLALNVVDSDGGRQRITELQQRYADKIKGASMGPDLSALLLVIRLDKDELGFRPLPQLPGFDTVTPEALAAAPRTSQSGAFGAFSIAGADTSCTWVALPQWKALSLARHPVALPVPEVTERQDLLASMRVKTEEDMQRVKGIGLLIVDVEVDAAAPLLEDGFYLVSVADAGRQQLQVRSAPRLAAEGGVPVAQVLFLARPPQRKTITDVNGMLQI